VTLYALLVGIDAYPADKRLSGAVADIDAVREFLDHRAPGARVRELLDKRATRQAVVDGFRDHLAGAGAGDVALFWFSGHGRRLPVPDAHRWVEPDGWLQTLVCVDSGLRRADGTTTPDLLDKELSLLLAEVAERGPHVVVVLDSCCAAGATRDLPGSAAVTRSLAPVEPAPPGAYLPGLDGYLPPPRDTHVLLAACRADEQAIELPIGAMGTRGAFSHALLGALARAGTGATYRDLLALARSRMLGLGVAQHPALAPQHAGPGDQPFLGGAVVAPAPFRLAPGTAGWAVDAGRCHGLPEPTPGAPLLFAVAGRPDRTVRVDGIGAVSCRVTPLGWEPGPDRVHPVVLAAVPVPPCAVVLRGGPDDDPAALDRVRAALRTAGPGGGPSPDLREAAPDEPVTGPRLWISAPVGGPSVLRLLRPDGTAAAPDVAGHDPAAAARMVAVAEHVARWELLRRWDNPLSRLAGAVRVELVEADPGDPPPDGRPALRPGDDGAVRLTYRWRDGNWEPPRVVVRLHNDAPSPLWFTLVALSDRYAARTALFPCARVAAGGTAAAREGRPVAVGLPKDRRPTPGASARDWLKLVATEEPAAGLSFGMPALGEPATRGGADPRAVTAALRRGAPARRGAEGYGTEGDWTSVLLPVVTSVPG